MKFQRLLVVFAVSVTISLCTGHIGGGQISLQNTDPQVYCGRTLARALALLCFKERESDKRSGDSENMIDSIDWPYYRSLESTDNWPIMSQHQAKRMGYTPRGKRYPGVVNECCDKPCSINELMTYC